jgi:predicted O-methyltransferase YrrM
LGVGDRQRMSSEPSGGEWIMEADAPEADVVRETIRRSCPQMRERTVDVLEEMYSSPTLAGLDGLVKEIGLTRISIEQGASMSRLVTERGLARSLEIGFAYGFSTIWLLDAVSRLEGGRHEAIDPLETRSWAGVGLRQVAAAGFGHLFTWTELESCHRLSQLAHARMVYDFVFVDGNHRFDDVLVDFYLSDKILRVGGLMALDDTWMPSVRSAVDFIVRNRQYAVVEQGCRNMVVFEKLEYDKRHWKHFEPFETSH